MIGIELLVVLAAIYLGARIGSIGIGVAGGLGVLVLTWGLGMPIPSDQLVSYIPGDVIMIIASVICAIACMQLAGGMDYLVSLAEKALRKNPKYITFAAPVVTYLMTMLAGTGHTAFSTLPVIAEVAKSKGSAHPVRSPSRLSPPRSPSQLPRSLPLWLPSPACLSRLAWIT